MEKDESLKIIAEKKSFPIELLSASNEERISYYKNYIVSHKFLEEAIDKTVESIESQISENLIFVCGPSGVGKKELINSVRERIINQQKVEQNKKPGCIPVVVVEAIAPEQGSFNFGNLWRSMLINLNEPMIDSKISYKDITVQNALGQMVNISKIQKGNLQEVLQNAIKYREVKAIIINEAHHMLRVSSGKKANWSIDLLKSLSNCSQTPLILVGTYELLNLLEDLDSGIIDQINQRAKVVNFPRYRMDVKNEVEAFGKTAKKLLLHMPLEQTAEKLVAENWKYLYKHSLGCIGILKNWFVQAYANAIKLQAKTLTIEHLEATKLPGYRCSMLLQSIEIGESKITTIQSEGDIEVKLGFDKSESGLLSNSTKSESKRNSKVGLRKIKRDTVSTG